MAVSCSNRVRRLDNAQALQSQVEAYLERQSEMRLLDSWIERLLHFLYPDESAPPSIVPFSLHLPDDVLALLPVSVRESVLDVAAQSFNADNMNADDLRSSDWGESTTYLEQFERSHLDWLLVKSDERLSELELEERQHEEAQHPKWKPEWFGDAEDRALTESAMLATVLEETKALEEWCEKASTADADDEEASLDQFVQLAELLINKPT